MRIFLMKESQMCTQSFMALLLGVLILHDGIATTAEPAHVPPVAARECRARGGLPNVFKKLDAGRPVNIAYLGGSITEAAGWRVLTLDWFRKQYPKSTITEIHAAISGTGAELGVCRLGRDVLRRKPDLLFVEFAVNGAGETEQRMIRTMEGIVRQTWAADPATDICFVYTMSIRDLKLLQEGKFSRNASVYERVAEHYGIPSIHLGMEVAKLEREGRLIFKGRAPQTEAEKSALGSKILFSTDGTHPLVETGHPFYLAAIVRSIPALKAAGAAGAHRMPPPLDPENWEKAHLVPLSQVARSAGWHAMDPRVEAATPNVKTRMLERWQAERPGETLTFKFKGTCFGLYGVKGPDAGTFAVSVDGRKLDEAMLFDSTCVAGRYRLWKWYCPVDLPDGEHVVRIELTGGDARRKVVALKKAGARIADTKPYEGCVVYAGDVMIVGDLVK